jgi:cysteinyl-tRNA synthetase
MQLHLLDTLSRETRPLSPRDGETFRFYCCGPTVYGPAHIGNFRTFVLQDVFRRTLELSGVKTRHVRNITDVDDKTIRDSAAAGETLTDFTQAWTEKFHTDCEALGLLEPHEEPSAIGHIPQQIELIKTLMEQGNAYQSDDGSVYFKVSSFPKYGRLSHLDERELRPGTSTSPNAAVADDEYDKDSVADFALWKSRKPEDGENFWDSPWGEGRPGWHLECSAMCREYLGDTFDLHSGGVDLVFPHHENEIAQSECATGQPFADHWFHTTHLLVDGRKMSKSLGNLYTLEQLGEMGHNAMRVRYVLISGLYRQPLNFTLQSLDDAGKAMARLAKSEAALRECAGLAAGAEELSYEGLLKNVDGAETQFDAAFEALLNDLNTPDALGKTFSVLKAIDPATLSPEQATTELVGLHRVLNALGLNLAAEVDENSITTAAASEAPAEIAALAEQRWQAKQDKNWVDADRLRDEVQAAGWEIKDGQDGYELTPKA